MIFFIRKIFLTNLTTGTDSIIKNMKRTYIIAAAFISVLIVGFIIWQRNSYEDGAGDKIRAQDYKNATYIIEGRSVVLHDGYSESEAVPGAATKIVTRFFGNEVQHDLNDDGREDVVFLLTQETGGSGVFYYVVAALNTPTGYIGSHALFLGDRIAPQTTELDEGRTVRGTNRQNVIVVNYAERLSGEPFTARPSVGKSIWIKLDPENMRFGEVAQDFEGEAR